jgi:hypothetical protein
MQKWIGIGAIFALVIVASWHFVPAAAEAG